MCVKHCHLNRCVVEGLVSMDIPGVAIQMLVFLLAISPVAPGCGIPTPKVTFPAPSLCWAAGLGPVLESRLSPGQPCPCSQRPGCEEVSRGGRQSDESLGDLVSVHLATWCGVQSRQLAWLLAF